MHPAQIKAALEMAGFTQSSLARRLSGRHGQPLTSAAVGVVLRGVSRSARIAREISTVTGIPVAQLWPGKYPDLEAEQRAHRARPAASQRAARPRTNPKEIA